MRTIIIMLLLLATGCDEAKTFKQQQIKASNTIAQGSAITPPATPPARAEDLADDLPVDLAWTVLEYNDNGGQVTAKLLSTSSAEATTLFVHGWLEQRGYDSGDNLSRLLDGVTYTGQGKYKRIYAKVGLNTADEVTVELRGE
jgi:hypothetical protein